MALTQRLRYVNTASSAGGNGTTNATSGANRAYPTLANAISSEAVSGGLVAADVYLTIVCEGTAPDTSSVDITGFTTDATHYVEVTTQTAGRHTGKWDTTKYRIEVAIDGDILKVSVPYCRIDGLQIKSTGNDAFVARGIRVGPGATGGNIRITNNIVRYAPTGTPTTNVNNIGIKAAEGSGSTTTIIVGNIVYDFRSNGIYVASGGSGEKFIIYNNTVVDCAASGFYLAGYGTTDSLYLINNICQNCTGNDYTFDTAFTTQTTSNNISEDASSNDVSFRSKSVTFVDEPGDDFHLSSGDTVAKDLGADLSADAQYAFNTDIDATTRSAPWDIGADEQAAGGGGPPPPGSGGGFNWYSFNGGFSG